MVVCNYYTIFRHLEDLGLLDPDQDLHVICLHYVFLPRLNWHLQEFMRMWDKHPLSTEGNRSPEQLWVAGLLLGNQENPEQVTLILLYNTLFPLPFCWAGDPPRQREPPPCLKTQKCREYPFNGARFLLVPLLTDCVVHTRRALHLRAELERAVSSRVKLGRKLLKETRENPVNFRY